MTDTTSFLEGQGIPVDLPGSRPNWRSSGARRPSRLAGRKSRTPMSPASCWPTWSSRAWGPMRVAGTGFRNSDPRFPCRAIVVRSSRRPRASDHGRSVGALPPAGPGLPQVCSERIVCGRGQTRLT